MDEVVPEEINKEKVSQQNLKSETDKTQISSIKNFISIMTEEETSLWFKKLNLEEEVLENLEKIIKNGKDLISIYNDNKILEKLNINLHSQNIINEAIEEGLEEELKINISLEKDKSIILNVENEPKYKLKEVLSYLEKILKRSVYLTPNNSDNEILTPNTLIVKKILLNPEKYRNLKIFDEKSLGISPPPLERYPIAYPKSESVNVNINLKKNKNEKNEPPSSLPLNNPILNDNKSTNITTTNVTTNVTNNTKMSNMTKGYVSLFQNKKNSLPDFNTDYQMPSQNRTNAGSNNNYIKLDTKEDFKYHNILSVKDKEEKEDKNNLNDMRYNDSSLEQKNIGFKNITNIGNSDNDSKISKNYFTQRNFNSKNMPNINDNNNNMMFQNILNNKKRSENFSGMMGKTIENIGGGGDDTTGPNTNANLSFLERNKKEKDRDSSFNINFMNKDSNNAVNKNKTESRYEFSRFQDLDKDNLFKNNNNNLNMFNIPKANEDNNEVNIDNLIINSNNNKNEELKNSKDKNDYKFGGMNNIMTKPEKEEADSDILKMLREKYSFQNNDSSKDLDNNNSNFNNRMNMDFKKEYKPKTPITDGRRTFGTENMNLKFNNNITDDNNNNPLENKFLMKQNNFLNKNDDDNIISKFKYDMNMDNNNKIGKNRNRPSAGLEFNSFQYKAAGYKSSFPQNQEKELNQLSQLNQYEQNDE